MKLTASLAVLALGVSALASDRSQIERQYKRWAKAALVNDVETILDVLAPDYTLHTYTGTVVPRKAYEVTLRKRKASKAAATVYQTKIASVAVAGKTAKVISDETSDTFAVDPISKKKQKLIHVHRYLDTWVKLGGVWHLQTTITQVESTKVVPA